MEALRHYFYNMGQCDFSYLTLAMTNFQSLLVEKITNYGGLFEVKLLGQNALFGAAKGPSSTLTAGKLLMAARYFVKVFHHINIVPKVFRGLLCKL